MKHCKNILILGALIFATISTAIAGGSPAFPLKISKNGRYFVDQNEAPFFYNAETAWRLFTNLTKEDAVALMKIRKEQGFNVIQTSLLANPEEKLSNIYGDDPFTSYTDVTTPYDPYFDHVKWVISEAEKLDLVIAITAVWKGCCGGDWAEALTENGPQNMRVFGKYLGKKFKDHSNINWILGGDNDPGGHLDHYRELAVAIERESPLQLQTFHAASSHSSSDVLPYSSQGWLDYTMTYTYYGGKDVWLTILKRGDMKEVYEVNHIEYYKRPIRPIILGESQYEGDGAPQNPDELDFPSVVRRQAYWSVLGGGSGHAYGSWNWKVTPEWRKVKDMPGAIQMGYFRRFFEDRRWHTYEPDLEGSIVSAGAGKYGQTDYITVSYAADKLGYAVYIPPSAKTQRTFTLTLPTNHKRLKAKWFDPTSGKYQSAGDDFLKTSEPVAFTTPGQNAAGSTDWLLAIESIDQSYEARNVDKKVKIDGQAETLWEGAPWASISNEWLPDAAELSSPQDFSGKYKALWSEKYLYLLVQITDDQLVDDIEDPLDDYWEDDLLEVFVDPDMSGGLHQNNYNAFAYHIAAKDGKVVDLDVSGKPVLFENHLKISIGKAGNVYTWEMAIPIYDNTFQYGTSKNKPLSLEAGKVLGFSIAYCDDDGNGRENFIGTVPEGLDSWIDASLFGRLKLIQ
ncbi:MAG: DUF4038 domain-containing protein [Cyclobacteriaceae bacterium]|nr:DUF4038 domain-containing protein [Cyclobacteriaceae bacterium HetDA_MAG_MS6]